MVHLMLAVAARDRHGSSYAVLLLPGIAMVHLMLAVAARDCHGSSDAETWEHQSLLHPIASTPEGLATPSICRAADLMLLASNA